MPLSSATRDQLLSAVEATYLLAERNFDRLYAAAATAADKKRVRALHASARDAYWKAVRESLEDANPVVVSIQAELTAANRNLKRSLEDLQDFAQALGFLTEAVKLAGSIVTLGAA